MIAFPRRVARRFRAACAKCIAGRPRGPAPCVVLSRANGRVTLSATFPDVTLELSCGTPAPGTEVLIVPMAVLDAVGGAAPDLVELEDTGRAKGTARWTEKGTPRTHAVEMILPGKQHDPLPRPLELKPVPKRFLAALHEAGRTTSREDGRFALSRVQVRGAKGQIIATDGQVAMIFDGFPFPFPDDLLVPAIPLFGCPEFRDDSEIQVGRTPQQFVVSSGDWTVWLGAAAGKFPDVAGVIPRRAPTVVTIGDRDAAGLLPVLPELPGQGHEYRPVTLDAAENGVLAVHAADGDHTRTVPCPNSPVRGPSDRAVLDRRVLARALVLGCRTLRLTPGTAVVAEGNGVAVLAAPLDPDLAASPPAPAPRTALRAIAPKLESKPHSELRRTEPMKPHETNGHPPSGRHDPPAGEASDPLTAAEDLRAALTDAATKAARLVVALRQSKKEKKVLSAVLTGLKQLNLGAEGGPR